MSILSISNLTYKYNNNIVFKDLSLTVNKGEFVCITGANGSGKTTLIKIMSLLLECDNITLFNKKVNSDNLYDIRKNIGVILDDIDNYFLCDTVIEELAFTLENLSFDKKTMDKRIAYMTKIFNISHLLRRNPRDLSGGEKIKIAIICALMHNPKLLLIDTYIGMIDCDEKKELINILSTLHKKGLTIILMTNDLSISYKCDRLIILKDKSIYLDDIPINIFNNDKKLTRSGIELPFPVELSIKLKLYGLIDDIYYDIKDIVGVLWH